MYKLIVSELAHQDLDNIVSYIAVELANPVAASDFFDEVEACYGYLKSNPMMFTKCQDNAVGSRGLPEGADKKLCCRV
jgi:toxin ParE1/3/4